MILAIPGHDTLTITVIRPILEYALPQWHPTLTKSQAERLEAVQRRAINIIFGYSSPPHI